MPKPRVTIGMAHFDDYDGVWSTLHALRRYHDTSECELLVVDNSPKSPHGRAVADLCGKIGSRYLAFADAVGTSAPRNRVFAEARGEIVVCMDCHVLLDRGAVDAIRDFYAHGQHRLDMLCGPLLNDGGGLLGTHFNDFWRAEMWGIWGSAWECPCHRLGIVGADDVPPLRFSPMELPTSNGLYYVELAEQRQVSECPRCGGELPAIGWAGHERQLTQAGYVWLGADPRGEPFEVPGQGLGLFAMRADAWVGFNEHARGFGGEELYVHAKVRRAGGHVYCHPAVRWTHRFGRPAGVPYTIGRYPKVRNYVLEFQELGYDLAPIREHFVESRLMPEREWKYLLVNPIEHTTPPGAAPCGGASKTQARNTSSPFPQPPADATDLDAIFEWCRSLPRDLDQHAEKIRELAGEASHVTAVVKRREWDVFLLAGRPDDVVTYTAEHDALHDTLHRVVLASETNPRAPRRIKNYTVHGGVSFNASIPPIEDTDLLVIDTIHHADRLYAELTAWADHVRGRIVIRGTQAFGEIAEGRNGPGLLVALRRWMRERPEWSVVYHSAAQYGLTVISRLDADKPKIPGAVKLAANFAKAMAEHVSDGLHRVDAQQLQGRLEACTLCDQRRNNRCAACGCFLAPKASIRSSVCPLGKWPVIDQTPSPTSDAA